MISPRVLRIACFVSVCCAFALLAVLAARPLQHDDLFFHLRTGALIAATGSIPHVDSYSLTVPGAPWTTHEWGFGLIAYGVYRAAGYQGLVWLTSLLAIGVFWFTYLLMRRLASADRAPVLVPLLVVGVFAAQRSGFIMRAALFSSLGFALLLYLLHLHHAQPNRRRTLGVLALIWVWANVHVGVVFGLGVVWLSWVQATWDVWLAGAVRNARTLVRAGINSSGALALACTLLTLANANGYKLWTFPFELNALYYHSGVDWTLHMFQSPRLDTAPFFFLLVALTLAACLPLSRLRALLVDRSRPMLMQSLGALFFLVMALRSQRFILEFAIFALPLCAAVWGGLVDTSREPAKPRWVLAAHFAGAAAVVIAAIVVRPRPPTTPIAQSFPKYAVDFIERKRVHGRMFNYENWGGYLGWRLNLPVYWDGRNDVFGAVAKEFAYTEDVAQLVRRHRLDMLVLDSGYHDKFQAYLRAHRGAWALIYFDDTLALYVRKDAQPRALIERNEYQLLRPFGVPSSDDLARMLEQPAARGELQTEIARVLEQNPESYVGWYLRGALARALGDLPSAYRAWLRASSIQQPSDLLYAMAEVAHAMGNEAEARKWLQRVLDRAS
jgi:hypothetical protein